MRKRLSAYLLLSAAMLLGQYAALAHAIGHITQHDTVELVAEQNETTHEICQECMALSQFGNATVDTSPVAPASLFAVFNAAVVNLTRLSTDSAVYAARAPPSSTITSL